MPSRLPPSQRDPQFALSRAVSAIQQMTPGSRGGQVKNASPVRPAIPDRKMAATSYSPVETVNTVAASSTAQTLPDVIVATIHYVTLTANCTFTFPTAGAGKSFTLILVQDGTGSRTATWPASVKWAGGTAPTLTTTASKRDVFSFLCPDGSSWLGFTAGLAYA